MKLDQSEVEKIAQKMVLFRRFQYYMYLRATTTVSPRGAATNNDFTGIWIAILETQFEKSRNIFQESETDKRGIKYLVL